MTGLGRISNGAQGAARVTNPAQHSIVGAAKAVPTKIAASDAGVASIRDVYRLETAEAHRKIDSAGGTGIWPETMADFAKAIREKIARWLKLIEEIAGGHFSPDNLAKAMSETNAALQLGVFSAGGVGLNAAWVLRYQDIEPQRVLFLLRSG
jgi:hypothetical protein